MGAQVTAKRLAGHFEPMESLNRFGWFDEAWFRCLAGLGGYLLQRTVFKEAFGAAQQFAAHCVLDDVGTLVACLMRNIRPLS